MLNLGTYLAVHLRRIVSKVVHNPDNDLILLHSFCIRLQLQVLMYPFHHMNIQRISQSQPEPVVLVTICDFFNEKNFEIKTVQNEFCARFHLNWLWRTFLAMFSMWSWVYLSWLPQTGQLGLALRPCFPHFVHVPLTYSMFPSLPSVSPSCSAWSFITSHFSVEFMLCML